MAWSPAESDRKDGNDGGGGAREPVESVREAERRDMPVEEAPEVPMVTTAMDGEVAVDGEEEARRKKLERGDWMVYVGPRTAGSSASWRSVRGKRGDGGGRPGDVAAALVA